jgi:hypothetical protein
MVTGNYPDRFDPVPKGDGLRPIGLAVQISEEGEPCHLGTMTCPVGYVVTKVTADGTP